MSADTCIVALGARTPVGVTAESAAAAVRGGINRLRRDVAPTGEEDALFCSDALLTDPDLTATQRMMTMGTSALVELVGKLAAMRSAPGMLVPVLVGLPEPRPGFGPNEAARVAHALASTMTARVRLAVEPVPYGHAATLEALRAARQRLATGQTPLVIVGGVDSYIDAETLEWLADNEQWQSEEVRSGFIPGEGAGFVALMRPSDARSAGLAPLASVRAAVSTRETKLIKTDAVALGEALTAAVAQAIAPAAERREIVDEVFCDINGERYRSEEWGFVAMRLGTGFRDATAYRTAVGRWGDVGAASGALNLVLATQAWQRMYARGPHAMVWGSSEGGLRSAVLLSESAKNTRA